MDESNKIMKRRHERIVRVLYVPIRTHCPGTGYLACTGLMKTEVMVVQSRRDMKGSDALHILLTWQRNNLVIWQ